MDTVIIDHQSRLSHVAYALAMRLAYLVADHLWCAGQYIHVAVYYHQCANVTNSPQQLEYLSNYLRDDPEKQKTVVTAQKILRNINKMKHKSAEAIVQKRTLEKMMADTYAATLKLQMLDLEVKGFMRLLPLVEEGTIGIAVKYTDDPESEADGRPPLSEFILNMFNYNLENSSDAPGMLFLPPQFLSAELFPWHNYVSPEDATAADPGVMYLQHCFTIPNLYHIPTAEMQALRKYLRSAFKPFRQHVDTWLRLSATAAGTPAMIDYMKEHITPAAADVQHALDDNVTLQYEARETKHETRLPVMLGEMPAEMVVSVFREAQVVPETTLKAMEQKMQENERLRQKWPVITVIMASTPPGEDTDIYRVKKSITVE